MWRFSPLIESTDSKTELSTELYSKAQNLLVLKLDGLLCILKGNMFWDQHLLGWFIPYSSLDGGRKAGVKSRSLGEYVKRQILFPSDFGVQKVFLSYSTSYPQGFWRCALVQYFQQFWKRLHCKLPNDCCKVHYFVQIMFWNLVYIAQCNINVPSKDFVCNAKV
jgi:hypothetical protein